MWQTLAQIAIPIALEQGIKYLTKDNNPRSPTSSPNQGSGWNSNTVDQSPGWESRTGRAWQSTISNPNLPISSQNVPSQKPGVYNDLLQPVVKETGNQLAKEAVGYFASGETGPLISLLGKGATYLTALL
jgi:hypothetical protein